MKTNVAFFGTSDRSTPILNALHTAGLLKLCVTKTDRLVGRHQTLKSSGVKQWAENNDVRVIEVDSLKAPNDFTVISTLKEHAITLGVVADFSLIVPKSIIDYFAGKLINIHFSLLPKYRGASPVQFALLNGDKTTGITYQILAEKVDTGDIIFQSNYDLTGNETALDLWKTLFDKAGTEVVDVLAGYENGKYQRLVQDESKASHTNSPSRPKTTFIDKEDARIDFTKETPTTFYNKYRAFKGWPTIWTTAESFAKCNFLQHSPILLKSTVNPDMKIKFIEVTLTGEDKIELVKVQPEGKNVMDWLSFANGYLQSSN